MKENLISDKSLIYQWTFNDNMSIVDNPRVKATVFGNPTYNNGIATFNGSTDYYKLKTLINLGNKHSIEVKFKQSSVATEMVLLGGDSNNKLSIGTATLRYKATTEKTVAYTSNLNWNTLCFTRSGDNYAMYNNGVSLVNGTGMGTSNFLFNILGALADFTLKYAGQLEYIKIWNRQLSASEVKLSNAGVLQQSIDKRYPKRVSLDVGTTRKYIDIIEILRFLINNKGTNNRTLYDNTKLLIYPEIGVKTTTVGIYKNVDKVYSIDKLNTPNDAVQITPTDKPYLSGNIAPNEKLCIKNNNGLTGSLTHPAISFAANESWSITTVLNWNGSSLTNVYYCGAIGYGGLALVGGGNNSIRFRNNINIKDNLLSNVVFIGKSNVLTITANGTGTLFIFLNGLLVNSVSANTAFILTNILNGFDKSYAMECKLYYHIIRSQYLTQQQVTTEYNFLRAKYPEIESVLVGAKYFASSNLEIVCSTNGTVIADANLTATWATGVSGWCYHTDAIVGSIFGKMYNKAARNVIIANPPSGWHVATESELTALVAGGANALKMTGTNYWTTANGTNTTGLTVLGGGSRNVDGTFNTLNSATKIWCADSDKCLLINDDNTCSIAAITANEGAYIRLVKN